MTPTIAVLSIMKSIMLLVIPCLIFFCLEYWKNHDENESSVKVEKDTTSDSIYEERTVGNCTVIVKKNNGVNKAYIVCDVFGCIVAVCGVCLSSIPVVICGGIIIAVTVLGLYLSRRGV